MNRGRSFKFEESWLLRTDCEEVVQEAWGKAGEERVGLAAIQEKIKVYGEELMAWGSPITEFLGLSKRMDELLQK